MNEPILTVDPPTTVSDAGTPDASLAGVPAVCGACGAVLSSEVERIVRRLLGLLDEPRRSHLVTTYGGEMPDVLCALCFNTTLSVLNAGVNAA